jgi:hypothetical protein
MAVMSKMFTQTEKLNKMKTKRAGKTNLIEGGRERLESTNEFKRKVEEINGEVRGKYSLILLNEKNWAKRILIIVRREIEIRKRIAELSSRRNLHATHY